MRSEQEMLNVILNFANEDERIRGVIMNGSRVNPEAQRDIFQDYDIVFVVSSVADFVRDRSWIDAFGELLIMQTPDENVLFPSHNLGFAFLMLFQDGNRIDLTLFPVDQLGSLKSDSLSQLLLDKDSILGPFPPANNKDYLTTPPTERQFRDCCNEFWWVSTYIAKGLWRRELPYARYMFDGPVRDMLTLMLQWYIGVQESFSVDSGKCGKYFEKYLPARLWELYVETLADGEYENVWRALFIMGDLFREIALVIRSRRGGVGRSCRNLRSRIPRAGPGSTGPWR